jgi:hypothetical protein
VVTACEELRSFAVLQIQLKGRLSSRTMIYWTLSIVLYFIKHDVSETGFCLRLQVDPTQMGPIERASLRLRTPPTAASEAVGGMLGKRNRSTRRKSAPVPLYPPQIPHDLIGARTRVASEGS